MNGHVTYLCYVYLSSKVLTKENLIAVLNILIEFLFRDEIQEITLADDTIKTNWHRFHKNVPFLRWYFKNCAPKIELFILIEWKRPANINQLLQN